MIPIARQLVLLAILGTSRWWFVTTYGDASPDGAAWVSVVAHTLTALTVLSLVLLIDLCLKHFFWEGYLVRALGAKVPRLLPLTVTLALYLIAIFNLLNYDYNVSLGGALAASGMVAVILGFALRSVILDLFSGLAVSIDRSYSVGDWITVTSRDLEEPVYGQVEELDWRTTRLRLEDSTLFVMPNSIGGAFSITNHSQPRGPKRFEISFLLPHETPWARAFPLLKGAATKAVTKEGFFTTPPPQILMGQIGLHGVEYLVRFYADNHIIRPSAARAHIARGIHEAVLQNRLSFPGEKVELANRARSHRLARTDKVSDLSALERVSLLSGALTPEELSSLADRASPQSIKEGATLIEEGADGDSLFIVLAGAAAVQYTNGSAAPKKLATLSTGDVVGEMSLLTGAPRSASVVAETPLDVLEISKKELAPLMKRRPAIAEQLSWLLADRRAEQDKADLDGDVPPIEIVREGLLNRIKRFFSL